MKVNLYSWKDSRDLIRYCYVKGYKNNSKPILSFENSFQKLYIKTFNRLVFCRKNFFGNVISNEKHNTSTISISIQTKWCSKTIQEKLDNQERICLSHKFRLEQCIMVVVVTNCKHTGKLFEM